MAPLVIHLVLMGIGFLFCIRFANILAADPKYHLYSRPIYYGLAAVFYMAAAGIGFLIVTNIPGGPKLPPSLLYGIDLVAIVYIRRRMSVYYPAREEVEKYIHLLLVLSAVVSILLTGAILLSVVYEALRFFEKIPVADFLLGTHWSPQSAEGDGQGQFGAIPLFSGTLLITAVAMVVAVPVGLFTAIYTAEYASRRFRNTVKPMLEILAGIPTVVYGYFAVVTIAPFLRETGLAIGLPIAAESALGAGFVMGVMIIPFISSLSDDIISAIPNSLREASYGLGATKSETIRKVVIPAALPGIMGAVLLAISRAIGETMIVVMAAGLAANLTINPLEAVTTVTAQIVALLTGDQEFDSAKTLAAFGLGLTLFIVTLCLNVLALVIVKKYREEYE